jgi:PKD repeat protein
MVAFNTSSTFGIPVIGTTYTAGNTIPGGGTILHNGTNTNYSHTGLNPNTTYYYKAWSVATGASYSTGTTAYATTTCSSYLPVSLTISVSANPVCAGTSVIFTATPTNGGTTPSYQWKVNGTIAGINSATYSFAPVNNDVVTCMLTSNLICTSGNPANSNALTMTVDAPLTANFAADKLTPLKNETVLFTDLTTGGATAWNWSFDRPDVVFVNGTSAQSQNPQVQFTDGGLYQVTLLATNFPCSDSEIKSGYLRAGISGLWTGNTSSEWNTLSNWDNYLLPDGNTDIVIPPSSSFWPVFEGDLIFGIHCRNLILSGTSSMLTITGDLVIQ